MARKLTDEEYKQKLRETNPEFESLAPYQGNKIKIPHRHMPCGYVWDVKPNVLDQNTHGCPLCSGKVRKDIDYFKNEVKQLVGDEYSVIGEYVNFSTKVSIKHNKCGYVWKVKPSTFLGKESGCPKCNQSKGELRIEKYLLNNGINYIYQMKYDDLVGVKNIPLSYDFYLPDFNLLIEYQGQQHEYAVDWFGGEEKFKRQKEIDKIKNNYAKEHNIELLEIWYIDFDNIEQILESRLLKQSA